MQVNIADLIAPPIQVEVSPGKFLPLRTLTLEELMFLFLENQNQFLTMYAQFESKGTVEEKIGVMLVAAPDFVVKIIALSADAKGQEDVVKRLPPTVQLIALHELWKASVPDPKKAAELWSVVMARLQKLAKEGKQSPSTSNSKMPDETLATESLSLSSTSLPTGTPSPVSGSTP